jgi:SAM-dependent methyltransferase
MTPFACRSCGASNPEPILDLGRTPLANALLTAEQLGLPEPTYPLELVFCPKCALVQITETVPPEQLFREYLYLSSFSDTMVRHAGDLAARLARERSLGPGSRVVEVASNDGYLLQHYRRLGVPVLGVEPARNVARVAESRGIPTVAEFFGLDLARRLLGGGHAADVIHAHNVVAHVADLHGVVGGIAALLKPDGVAVVENHYVRDLIDRVEFDAIYHEHLCYYSVASFAALFRRHGLELVDVERIPVHGGSLRVFFQRADGPRSMQAAGAGRVRRLLDEEAAWGAGAIGTYRGFGGRVESLRRGLVDLLARLKSEGRRIAAYGASAKSTTLLSYCKIGAETIDFVADRSTVKQGRFTPGTRIPIVAPERLLETRPDHVLLLTWNFADEILAQQAEYRRRGGRFIIPIPELKIV